MRTEITPTPTDEEAVVIMAATEALWPKPVMLFSAEQAKRTASWRFSGRWWTRPVAARRERPYF